MHTLTHTFSDTLPLLTHKHMHTGYRPEAGVGQLYPNEVASDFALIPFGKRAASRHFSFSFIRPLWSSYCAHSRTLPACCGLCAHLMEHTLCSMRAHCLHDVAPPQPRDASHNAGGGARKCIGDQFAMFEATIAIAMLLRRFTFEFAVPAEKVCAVPFFLCFFGGWRGVLL